MFRPEPHRNWHLEHRNWLKERTEAEIWDAFQPRPTSRTAPPCEDEAASLQRKAESGAHSHLKQLFLAGNWQEYR